LIEPALAILNKYYTKINAPKGKKNLLFRHYLAYLPRPSLGIAT